MVLTGPLRKIKHSSYVFFDKFLMARFAILLKEKFFHVNSMQIGDENVSKQVFLALSIDCNVMASYVFFKKYGQ